VPSYIRTCLGDKRREKTKVERTIDGTTEISGSAQMPRDGKVVCCIMPAEDHGKMTSSAEISAGWLESVRSGAVSGWAVANSQPQHATVEIYLDDMEIGECLADRERPDVLANHPNFGLETGFQCKCDLSIAGYSSRVSAKIKETSYVLKGSGRFVLPAVGPKLFFLHIPKTAGTTINYIASQLWLRTRDHVENSDWRHTPTFEWFNFLSGHLCAERAIQSYRNSGFSFFTMFRDPVSQFYSHVRWLQHYAEYPPEHARKLIAPLNYQLAMELASAGTGRNNQVACLTSLLDNQVLGP
jgi:hypothetical protein